MSFGKRPFIVHDSAQSFRVCTWNILADHCCTDDENGFPFTTAAARDPEKRALLRIEEIKSWNADVIALQEADNVEHLKKDLFALGYYVKHFRRDDSPLGILLALKTGENLTPITAEKCLFKTGGQIYAVLTFYYRNVHMTLVAVHLKAKSANESVRLAQVKELADKFRGMNNLIVVGDFNDEPRSKVWMEMCKTTQLIDAYSDHYPQAVTTSKIRPVHGVPTLFERTIDYIFYRDTAFVCIGLMETVRSIEPHGLPNEQYPSDHLSIGCDFIINARQ